MEFQQKRMATQTWFTFNKEDLDHRVRDNSADVEFTVAYSSLPPNKRVIFDRNNWLRNVGLIWCALGVINIGLAFTDAGPTAGSAFWLMIGLGCLAFYRLTWSEYTVFDTEEGAIWVLKDDQHDEIIQLLKTRSKEQLLSWYRSLDFGDDPMQEIQTIEWLVKRDALSKDEAQMRISEIRAEETMLLAKPNDDAGPQVH